MRENADQNDSEYGHFLRSERLTESNFLRQKRNGLYKFLIWYDYSC